MESRLYHKENPMTSKHYSKENLTDQRVTYSLALNGMFYIFENVPARVDEETGEVLFAPETVTHLQRLIVEGQPPDRMMSTPVYRFEPVDCDNLSE